MTTLLAEVQDIMVTIELALLLNSDTPKSAVVQRTSKCMRKKYKGNARELLNTLAKASNAYECYTTFMDTLGL